MFTANDFHTALIQLMHRAGRGEKVISELDDLIARLEQTRPSQSMAEWRHSIAGIRGSLITHFGSAPTGADVTVPTTDHPEMRRVFFVEAAITRLARLMTQPT